MMSHPSEDVSSDEESFELIDDNSSLKENVASKGEDETPFASTDLVNNQLSESRKEVEGVNEKNTELSEALLLWEEKERRWEEERRVLVNKKEQLENKLAEMAGQLKDEKERVEKFEAITMVQQSDEHSEALMEIAQLKEELEKAKVMATFAINDANEKVYALTNVELDLRQEIDQVVSKNQRLQNERDKLYEKLQAMNETAKEIIAEEIEKTSELARKLQAFAFHNGALRPTSDARTVTITKNANGKIGIRRTRASIYTVYTGSPAEKERVMPGDQIVSVDGVAVENMRRSEINELFKRDSSTITLVLRHNPERFEKATKESNIISSITEPKDETRTVTFTVGDDGLFALNHISTSISEVREGSPAFNAGLKRGDQMIAINGVNIETVSLDEISEMFLKAREISSISLVLRSNPERLKDLEDMWNHRGCYCNPEGN